MAQWRVRGSEMSVSANYKSWKDGRPQWREGYLAARHNTKYGVGILRFSHVDRAELADEKFELEAYPLFKGGYGSLGAGFATDGTIYATSTFSAEIYADVVPKLEASLGARRVTFAHSLTMLTSSVGWYHRDYLFGARVNYVMDDAVLLLLSARRYFRAEADNSIGVQVSGGTSPAEFRSSTDLDVQASRSIALDGQFVIATHWMLRARFEFGSEKLEGGQASTFTSADLGSGIRF